MSTAKQTEWAREKSPFRTADYEMHQVWFESKDKTRVPMFIAHKKGLKLDGSAPAYLTAYGGFRIVMKPYFSARFIPWLDQGGCGDPMSTGWRGARREVARGRDARAQAEYVR